jgi:hypothetical protein
MRMSIIWIASYPKSGNTYVRLLLYQYLYGRAQTGTQVEQKMPDLHRVLAQGQGLHADEDVSVFVKTHFLYRPEHPYIDRTQGFIYVLRHPRDVLLSHARFFGACDNPQDHEAFAREFIDHMGAQRWIGQDMGSWPEHVGNWMTAAQRCPHLFLKFEDLRAHPGEGLRKMIEFLHVEVDEQRLQEAVAWSDLDEARRLERDELRQGESALFDRLPDGRPFVGEGKTTSSLDTISPEIETLFQLRFNGLLGILGYA